MGPLLLQVSYYCSQAAAQLGGRRYWEQIFPPIVNMFLKAQAEDE